MSQNPFLLAADNHPDLLPLLRANPSLASGQDEYGYSLVHAATSYNHLDLLRALIKEFKVDVNITDEDGETALYVTETVDAAKLLVEELNVNLSLRNHEGQTAREKILAEDDYPEIAAYLALAEAAQTPEAVLASSGLVADPENMPAVPEGLKVTVGEMEEADPGEADPTIRKIIEGLSKRPDFDTPEVQAQVRELVMRVLNGEDVSALQESLAGSS
ncbi:hypothetical protein TD95_002855 [Thielaviopsis punctulata]|uniref:Uncharacterized protein n=1 Tax=Thielaviopsis punctulata TaxID=72032 RepID=A0A0F4ZDX5_9PEZI|nr:hypothetical protein TD95_002855 [Thielaviopsis punctulata]